MNRFFQRQNPLIMDEINLLVVSIYATSIFYITALCAEKFLSFALDYSKLYTQVFIASACISGYVPFFIWLYSGTSVQWPLYNWYQIVLYILLFLSFTWVLAFLFHKLALKAQRFLHCINAYLYWKLKSRILKNWAMLLIMHYMRKADLFEGDFDKLDDLIWTLYNIVIE